jgi:hypothetical protein
MERLCSTREGNNLARVDQCVEDVSSHLLSGLATLLADHSECLARPCVTFELGGRDDERRCDPTKLRLGEVP